MTTPSISLEQVSGKLTREEIAKREIGRTDVSPRLAWVMTVAFLLTLAVPPVAQGVHEACLSESSRVPACLELLHALPDAAGVFERTNGSLWNRVLTTNRHLLRSIESYEHGLEERSLLSRHLLGPTQKLLTGMTGLGNEKAYVGRDGWLFYRPDVDYLTGPGFLDPAVLRRRALGGKEHTARPQPDPRPAIIDFHEQLARRGIRLILMPVPGKSAIHPERLSSRFSGTEDQLENGSFRRFKEEMEQAGVLVFDPATALTKRKLASGDAGQFLRTDTHWAPDAMQFVAEQLQTFIERNCPLPLQDSVEYREQAREVENLGDVAAMLHLPASQTLFPAEKVTIREVTQPDGRGWEPDESADVLLMGDSYTNIYSLPEMNWGASAGLAEQLGFSLRRRIDRLAQNDGGAHAVRQALLQQMARGHDRLQGKRVIIWEFAVRELAVGDWKILPLPDRPPEKRTTRPSTEAARNLVVQGTVRAAAGAPQPGSVPYRDAVTAVHLSNVETSEGTIPNTEIVVYLWGLRDDRLMNAGKFSPDQKVKLRLTPWDAVRDKYERFNRIELDDPDFKLVELPTYWGEEVP